MTEKIARNEVGDFHVLFGGQIGIGCGEGYSEGKPATAVYFQMLKEAQPIGTDRSSTLIGPRVWLVFNNPDSIKVTMRALIRAKHALVKKLKEEKHDR